MTQNMHYYSKSEKREHSEEILDQSKTKNQLGNYISDVKMFFKSSTPSSFSFNSFHTSLSWADSIPVSNFPQQISHAMALVFPTSWGLQDNRGFTFTASHNDLSRPACRDIPAWIQWFSLDSAWL